MNYDFRQRLGNRSAVLLKLIKASPATKAGLIERLPGVRADVIGGVLANLKCCGYIQFNGSGKHCYEITEKGIARLEHRVKTQGEPTDEIDDADMFAPNVSRKNGDLGGIKTASVWAYAAQVGA